MDVRSWAKTVETNRCPSIFFGESDNGSAKFVKNFVKLPLSDIGIETFET